MPDSKSSQSAHTGIGKSAKTRCRPSPELQPEAIIEQYRNLCRIGRELLAEPEMEPLLRLALDNLIEIAGAELGMIIVFDKSNNLAFKIARAANREDISRPEFEANRNVIDAVLDKRSSICGCNAAGHLISTGSNPRVMDPSFICVPLDRHREIFGVVYLKRRPSDEAFAHKTCNFVSIFADFISRVAHDALTQNHGLDRVPALEAELRDKFCFDSIIGHHAKMVEILDLVARVAETDATVLVQGESGTGKELVVKAIHYNSYRRNKPFLAINCGALPESLLESELFGHERGAFTGASQTMIGKFEAADSGTIFLDEVDSMSLALQVRLLRVLQSGEYSRLGSSKPRTCDVRIIAATRQNLKKLVAEGKFRDDLFYRINIVPIFLPPLRERKEDIPLLVEHFLKQFGKGSRLRMSKAAVKLLKVYDYPGNVRELENAIRRAVILSKDKMIDSGHLPEEMQCSLWGNRREQRSSLLPFHQAKSHMVEAFEKDYLIKILAKHKGVVSRAAKDAGLNRKNFRAKMSKLDIASTEFR